VISLLLERNLDLFPLILPEIRCVKLTLYYKVFVQFQDVLANLGSSGKDMNCVSWF